MFFSLYVSAQKWTEVDKNELNWTKVDTNGPNRTKQNEVDRMNRIGPNGISLV